MKWLLPILLTVVNTLFSTFTITMVYLDHGDLPKKLALPANFVPLKKEKTIFSREQLEQKAKSITVKVLSGEGWGSGIIISQANNVYTVITNYHVLIFSHDKTYQIQTPDGQVYRGDVLNTVDFGDYDLALLQFSSDREYEVASLSPIDFNPLVSEKAEVFSGGFPLEIENQQQAKGFYFNNGHLVRFSDLNFGGGYQIGYTNSIKKGMSGGPLLNKRGEIIGINGVHKYPLWGNPYLFSDGSLASEAQQEDMSQFSWAITVNSFLELAPQFLVPNN